MLVCKPLGNILHKNSGRTLVYFVPNILYIFICTLHKKYISLSWKLLYVALSYFEGGALKKIYTNFYALFRSARTNEFV